MLRTSARMPIATFFSVTSVFVALLAVILIGKGMTALQEAGWISATPVVAPRVDLLGMFPTFETVAAQLIVLAIALAGFGWNSLSARNTLPGVHCPDALALPARCVDVMRTVSERWPERGMKCRGTVMLSYT